MIKEEENCLTSHSRTSRSLSSPDSQSSFIDETEKSHQVDSSSDDSSEGSTASSLKRKLRDLPSPSEGSPFCDRLAYSYNRIFRKKQDFLYHLQELSNSIEEQDETEDNSAIRISSLVDSRSKTPRARRKVKTHEADKYPVTKNSHHLNLRGNPQFVNQEESDVSQNSSISDDLSGGRYRFNEINREKSSNFSGSSTGERRCGLYRNESKVQTEKPSPHSPVLPPIFPVNNSILSSQKAKKIGGYRPTSIIVQNISSESESDSENEQISHALTLSHFKAKNDFINLQSKIALEENQQSLESISSSNKFNKQDFLSRNEDFLKNAKINSKNDREFEDFLENLLSKDSVSSYSTPRKKTNQTCNKKTNSAPASNRSSSLEINRLFEKKNERFENNVENSLLFTKSIINPESENNFIKEISILQNQKKLEIPTLKLRSQSSSLSTSSKNNKDQFQDMKDLLSVLSDVSFKQENAFGDSGKYRFINSEHHGSGFSTGRHTENSPGVQIKSLETSHFKNVQETPRNILTSRSEHLEVKRSRDEIGSFQSLDLKMTKNKRCCNLKKETELKMQKQLYEKNYSPAVSAIDGKNGNKNLEKCNIPETGNNSSESLLGGNFQLFKRASPLKLEPISIIKTSLNSDKISSKHVKENIENFNIPNRKQDQSLYGLEKETLESVMRISKEEIPSNQQTKIQIQSETEAISNDSRKRTFESCIGDSHQQDQRKWAFHREIGGERSSEIDERCYQEPKEKENPSIILFQRCAHFNSMKLGKTESTAILSKKSPDDPNVTVKNCSSTSKLSFLLDSMKKEIQDRCPFTISESDKRNSDFTEESDEKKKTPQKLENKSEENLYKLETHPSITRLALSGTEIPPSELINFISENTPRAQNFLSRMKNYIRRIFTRLTRKNSSKNSAKILFQNTKCRFESAESSGSHENKQKCSTSSEESDKRHFSLQRFDSETESCRSSEVRSNRAKSSPVDIISRKNRFPIEDQSKFEDSENFFLERTKNEILKSRDIEEPLVSDIMIETRELNQNAETSCFCLCRSFPGEDTDG